jgi:LacI family transcriptional regulator
MAKFGRAKIADVAKVAGVSTATVDRVLNRRTGVRAETSERVWSVVARINAGKSHNLPLHLVQSEKTIDFLVPAGAGPSVEENMLSAVVDAGRLRNASIRFREIDRFDPERLANHIKIAVDEGSDGLALQALEHPSVRWAVDNAIKAGVPVITIQSDLSGSRRLGFVGIDNRAAGRSAAYLIGRFLAGNKGKVVVFAGSHLYSSHDDREMGFRRVCREDFPGIEVLDLILGHDDSEDYYSKISELLDRNPDIAGIYNVGSGNRGIVKALHERGIEKNVVFVTHHLTSKSRPSLLNGTIDAVIHQDMRKLADLALSKLMPGSDPIAPEVTFMPFEIVIRENVFE